MLAYVLDDGLKEELNRAGHNYWDVYIREINEMLGLRARQLPVADLAGDRVLSEVTTLVIGAQSGAVLGDAALEALDRWVESGGLLIGFALKRLDAVFGIQTRDTISQQPDDYSVAACFELWPHELTREVHPALLAEQRLLAFSDVQLVGLAGSDELARLYDSSGKDTGCPAITWRSYGRGHAGYFAFDVAKTIWLLHQGRPLPKNAAESSSGPKTLEMQVVGGNSRKVAYADELALVLQNMIAQRPHPFIFQVPPQGDKIPDALLYWGGDEYRGPTEFSLKASDWMRQKGLPYHINIESENHPMRAEEYRHIRNNDHEVSAYIRLYEEDGCCLAEKRYLEQSDVFLRRFGVRPVCTLTHNVRWKGWVEPARWMEKAGIQADNSFFGGVFTGLHPLHNGPSFSFGFGTSYPFFFYDSYEGGNRRIDVLEEPIICYEIGHRGSISPYRDKETSAREDVHEPVDRAIKYHLVMNMFHHPIYIVEYPRCREAIEEVLRYIEYRGANVVHMGNDQVCEWWRARSRSTVTDLATEERRVSFISCCEYGAGMIVKVPLKAGRVERVTCRSCAAAHCMKNEFGGRWLYVVVPPGVHRTEIELAEH